MALSNEDKIVIQPNVEGNVEDLYDESIQLDSYCSTHDEGVCLSYDENAGKGIVETKSHGKLDYYGRQNKLAKGEKYTFDLVQARIFQIFDTYSDTRIL